jgi:hypothetical protein
MEPQKAAKDLAHLNAATKQPAKKQRLQYLPD